MPVTSTHLWLWKTPDGTQNRVADGPVDHLKKT
jgi:hypothetical protein